MKKIMALVVAMSLCLMPMPVVRAELADPFSPGTPSIAEKAFVAKAVSAPVTIQALLPVSLSSDAARQ